LGSPTGRKRSLIRLQDSDRRTAGKTSPRDAANKNRRASDNEKDREVINSCLFADDPDIEVLRKNARVIREVVKKNNGKEVSIIILRASKSSPKKKW